MATFLFWNLKGKNLTPYLVTLCRENEIDVLILAESEGIKKTDFLEAVNRGQPTRFVSPHNNSSYISFFVKESLQIQNVRDDNNHRFAVREISLPTNLKILLVGLHLPSKLYMSEDEQNFKAMKVIRRIEECENQIGHNNTLVIGDFNMNPFEKGLVGADSFHAVMTQQTAMEYGREVDSQHRRFFYNPMWGRMGDTSVGPPGTYYYRGGALCYFWNTFDQVLLRPDLLDYFANDQLRVIDKIGQETSLLIKKEGKTKGRIDPNISDHLPIMITLNKRR